MIDLAYRKKTFQYNTDGQVTYIGIFNSSAQGALPIITYQYTYNAAGKLATMTKLTGLLETIVTFTYDATTGAVTAVSKDVHARVNTGTTSSDVPAVTTDGASSEPEVVTDGNSGEPEGTDDNEGNGEPEGTSDNEGNGEPEVTTDIGGNVE